jgi:hypothetical protein
MKGLLLIGGIFAQCHLVRIAYQEMGGRQSVPQNCCDFQGVGCDQDGQVSSIEWSNQALSGQVSIALTNIQNLVMLDLSMNSLSGPIPSEIEFMFALITLDLRGNRLNGEIPSEISYLTNLEELVLAENQLTGEIPSGLGSLTRMKFLFLSSNQLKGSIPDTLGKLTQLMILSIENNFLTGGIPASIGSTPIQRFDFSNTRLIGPISGNYTKLMSCVAGNTKVCRYLTGPSPRACIVPACTGGSPSRSTAPASRFTQPPQTNRLPINI